MMGCCVVVVVSSWIHFSFLLSFFLGRAYLFDHAVNVSIGKAEDRQLITGLHSVCDIFCKRCKNMVGWTYARAYEASQKYKENKFIIEKINLYLEESANNCYNQVPVPAGERPDRWRRRSRNWGDEKNEMTRIDPFVYEYRPPTHLLRKKVEQHRSTKSN
jgi:Yippee zinc-binding/DNA-binding /Mis18, centromere assembly